jgi:hypothetical protein
MIERLTHVDDDTVSAIGPRFDLDKVLETAMSILRTLQRRSAMRFKDDDEPSFSFEQDDRTRPFDDESYDLISSVFKACRETTHDVSLFSCEVRFGPFMTDLYPLGFDCLHGPVGNCLTDHDLNWTDLDPTPVMLVMMGRGMIDPIVGSHHDFLTKTLDSFLPQGILWEPYDDTGDELAFCIRFPHEAFGDGRGRIRISRHLHRVLRDHEEEE